MRKIKFRAWEIKRKTMLPVDTIEFPMGGTRWYGPGVGKGMVYANPDYDWKIDSILMQYTGLKDKTGKEIYGGDVVNIQNCITAISNRAWRIEYQEVNNSWAIENGFDEFWKMYRFSDLNAYAQSKDYWEIIGNIYENPELLEAKHGNK